MSPLERLARENHLLQPSCQLLACGKQLPEALLHSCTDGAKSPAVHTVDTRGVMNRMGLKAMCHRAHDAHL